MKKSTSKPKRYICICKVGNNPDGSAHCIRHHLDDLVKYVAFLDRQHPGWRYFNVYANRGVKKREQVGNFTKWNRPTQPTI